MSERDIFDAAVAIDHLAERAAYLDRVCAGNAGLRHRMEGEMCLSTCFPHAGQSVSLRPEARDRGTREKGGHEPAP